MSFKPPAYEHRAYYVFHKGTGRIAYSHRLLTIAGDDTVSRRFNERSMVSEAARQSGVAESDLDVMVETGASPQPGWIAGVDVKSRKLIRASSPRPTAEKST
jgi:hypothetical protein